MKQTCKHCRQQFEITDSDFAFYEKISPMFGGKKEMIPPPTLCPDCRQQRRLAFRNERGLFHRKCNLTGKQIIAMYPPDSPYKIYEAKEWYGDAWDPLQYGRDFDFSRPFFEQFNELKLRVPRMSIVQQRVMENSEYCNRASDCKNCHLIFSSSCCEDCYYGTGIEDSKDCIDCHDIHRCELCYECIDSFDCYRSAWLQACKNCSESSFLNSCIGCKNCLFCTNLQQKQYCIFNKQYTKEQYEQERTQTLLSRNSVVKTLQGQFKNLKDHMIIKERFGSGNEDVSGDFLDQCKNTHASFECRDLEDCKYLQSVVGAKDCMDYSYWGRDSELMYEVQGAGYNCRNIVLSCKCWDNIQNLTYCDICMHSDNLFGCIGLRHKRYCIFNKQYTKEQYEELVPKIIAHMRKDGGGDAMNPSSTSGSWGEFFPAELSHFGYNQTVAQDYFPLTEKEVKRRSWKWQQDEQEEQNYLGPPVQLPDDSRDATDDICQKILLCNVTGKPFKIIPQELKFYREMKVPLPKKCPDERHRERLALRNPRKLWERKCMKCGEAIQTTYAPQRKEIVYCERCYLQTVY